MSRTVNDHLDVAQVDTSVSQGALSGQHAGSIRSCIAVTVAGADDGVKHSLVNLPVQLGRHVLRDEVLDSRASLEHKLLGHGNEGTVTRWRQALVADGRGSVGHVSTLSSRGNRSCRVDDRNVDVGRQAGQHTTTKLLEQRRVGESSNTGGDLRADHVGAVGQSRAGTKLTSVTEGTESNVRNGQLALDGHA